MRINNFSMYILFKTLCYLEFKERYRFCCSNRHLFYEIFKEFKHEELINIRYDQNYLIDKWKNIKFCMYIYYDKICSIHYHNSNLIQIPIHLELFHIYNY